MQCINRDQTRIEWCQFECFGLKILITRGLVVIIGDFKSENSILTNLAPINWSIFWIKIITSHYTFFVVHQKLRNNKLEDGFVMNWHTVVVQRLTHFMYPQKSENVSIFGGYIRKWQKNCRKNAIFVKNRYFGQK